MKNYFFLILLIITAISNFTFAANYKRNTKVNKTHVPLSSEDIEVIIVDNLGKRRYIVKIKISDTVADLKKETGKILGIQVTRSFILVYKGKQLKCCEILKEKGIDDGSEIHLIHRFPPGDDC